MLQPKLLQGQLSSKIMEPFGKFIINRFSQNQPLILISVYSVGMSACSCENKSFLIRAPFFSFHGTAGSQLICSTLIYPECCKADTGGRGDTKEVPSPR